MEKISHTDWPEVVFGSSESRISQAIHRAVRSGKLKKIAPRLYTSNLRESAQNIIHRNLFYILGELFPGAVISHRSALDGGSTKSGSLVLSYQYTKNIQFPGIMIRLVKGPGAQDGDNPFVGKLYYASRERALLENLQPSKSKNGNSKVVSRAFIEEHLDKLCQIYGAEELNKLRDTARALVNKLNLETEFKILDKIVGGLLGTKSSGDLQSLAAHARALGPPYDSFRVELFGKLAAYLFSTVLPNHFSHERTEEEFRNAAFFDAYFSNYIEGTIFEIDEAEDILFRGHLNSKRPEDSHDILGTFQIVSNLQEMNRAPATAQDLINLLQHRHTAILSARKDKEPGLFKQKTNRAGNTIFIAPELVKGTFIKSFDVYQSLEPGIKRAIFVMFLVSEIHPFSDGNGRVARIMMNAELIRQKESRIIIPTVFREDYLLTLRRLTRQSDPEPYVKMLCKAQAFTASIDYSTYSACLQQFKYSNAFLEPSEGLLKF